MLLKIELWANGIAEIPYRVKNISRKSPEYIWKRLNDETSNPKEEARKLNDHGCDALRYLIMSLPSTFELSKEDEAPPGSFKFIMQKNKN